MNPRFIAYVYPGWHADPYRPGVDEWELLDGFRSYFDGHEAPVRPRDGRYDDADPATARRHVDTARAYGIEAFTYFAYRSRAGFVMDRPWELAHESAAALGGAFTIGATWCVRLPHDMFPVSSGDRLEAPATGTPDADPLDRPIQELSLKELTQIVDGWDDSWLDVPLTPRLHRPPPAPAPGADTRAAVRET